ncbi:MAG: hypothetical protein ACFFA5_10390 [Promethearchaeota archaeon]
MRITGIGSGKRPHKVACDVGETLSHVGRGLRSSKATSLTALA